jgi:hypothetical protein
MINQLEHFGGRAERNPQRHVFEDNACGFSLGLRASPLLGKTLGPGALERVDRLFLVTNGKQRAGAWRAPSPAKNSSDSLPMTLHCRGAVSCASSTRM